MGKRTRAVQPRKLTVGVILAGGQSKRMGQDKALLQIRGKTLLAHIIDILYAVRPKLDDVVVSGRKLEIPYVQDTYKNLGPLGGIYSVIHTVEQHAIKSFLIMPVDMPLMTQNALDNLLTHENSMPSFDAFIYKNNYFPLLLRLTPAVLRFFENPPLSSIQNLLMHLNTFEANWNKIEEHIFTNVNTPKDLGPLLIENTKYEH